MVKLIGLGLSTGPTPSSFKQRNTGIQFNTQASSPSLSSKGPPEICRLEASLRRVAAAQPSTVLYWLNTQWLLTVPANPLPHFCQSLITKCSPANHQIYSKLSRDRRNPNWQIAQMCQQEIQRWAKGAQCLVGR